MRTRQRGIFLIEAMIALLVLAVGLVAVVKFESTLAASGSVAKQRTEATMLAQREIENLRAFVNLAAYDAYFAAGSPATVTRSATGENANYAITATLVDHNDAVRGRHANVDVKVSWSDQKGQAHEVHLFSSIARIAVASSGELLASPVNAPPPVVVCPAGVAKTWTVSGATCSGTVGTSGGIGLTRLVSAATNTGTNQYVCLADGTWSEVTSYPRTCAATCPAMTVSWTGTAGATCSAALAQASDGATSAATDAIAPVTGNASYSCTNGSWTLAAAPAATCTATCPAGVLAWGALTYNGANRCEASLPATTAPLTQSVDNSVSGQLSASATYVCTNLGSWNRSASTCQFTSPTPGYCLADSVSWSVGGLSCTGLRPQTASGQSYTVAITEGSRLGQATYACASGSWSGTPTSPSCTNNCFVQVSGQIAANAAKVYLNGVAASCTVSNNSYLCSSLPVTEGANATLQAIKNNGDAAGTLKTLASPACGQSYTLDLR